MGGLSLPQPNWNGKEGPSLNSLDTLKWAPQGGDHGPSLDISRSYRETLLHGAWLKISGHILTGKLMKSCRTHLVSLCQHWWLVRQQVSPGHGRTSQGAFTAC